jgi:hypothetical protein
MQEAVSSFLMAVKRQGQLQPLLESADLRVSLISDQQTIVLVIKHGEVTASNEIDMEHTTIKISGQPLEITRLLEGRERLRVLQKSRRLMVSAPLRIILLLESMFYLTMPHGNLVS